MSSSLFFPLKKRELSAQANDNQHHWVPLPELLALELRFHEVFEYGLTKGKIKYLRMTPEDAQGNVLQIIVKLGLVDEKNYIHKLFENGDFDKEYGHLLPDISEDEKENTPFVFVSCHVSVIEEVFQAKYGVSKGSEISEVRTDQKDQSKKSSWE